MTAMLTWLIALTALVIALSVARTRTAQWPLILLYWTMVTAYWLIRAING